METTENSQQPNLDMSQLETLITNSVNNSFKEAFNSREQETQAQTQATQERDPWADIVEPIVNPRLQQLQLSNEAAQDKIDFYSSDTWLENINEHFTSDDVKKEKAEFRAEIEKTFTNLLRAGKPLPREDIAQYLLGQKVVKQGASYHEAQANKRAKKKEDALKHAQRAVEFQTGNISTYTPQNLFDMDHDKLVENFGSYTF